MLTPPLPVTSEEFLPLLLPWHPRSEYPLHYGTRSITLPHSLRQAVSSVGHLALSPSPRLTVAVTTLLVSLQQMVQFGQNPSQGTLLRASQFLLGKFEV